MQVQVCKHYMCHSIQVCSCEHLFTCTAGPDCQYAYAVCSAFLLWVYACTAVAFHTYTEYSCSLPLHGWMGLHMEVHSVSFCACVCEVWVFVCVLTLASCSCRGSLVASGQLSSWERCSHTIWANLSTLPLSACSNSHAWHIHTHTYVQIYAHTCPYKHVHIVHMCT